MMGALLSEHIGASETVRRKVEDSSPACPPDPGRLVIVPDTPSFPRSLRASPQQTPPHNAARRGYS
jgi:hypothetical protein